MLQRPRQGKGRIARVRGKQGTFLREFKQGTFLLELQKGRFGTLSTTVGLATIRDPPFTESEIQQWRRTV